MSKTGCVADYVNANTFCIIDCCICGETEEENGIEPGAFANQLESEGWKVDSSEKFQVEGAMCPTCGQQEDAERGESQD